MKSLYTDDRTGKRSNTTLRTWIVFILTISYLIALSVLSIISPDSLRPLHMDLIQWLIVFYGAAGSLYLGKRINENLSKTKGPMILSRVFNDPKQNESVGSSRL
ncbi:hypothetical protein ACQV5J_16225 [Leptospira interrogans]|uniref:hypothetical protein n=1 Tax=Leptospira interrogans TaxID=173 RepID=UPI0002FB05A1|nr:hypothetical protein [Leptospira interrogans]OOB99142.1 hypothetical protein B0192_07075 [Leptospira interrogans serovar Australis]